MPTREELKAKVCQEIDDRRDEIINIAETILRHPEPGFKEFKTAALVDRKMTELGIPHETGIAITGVKGLVGGGAGAGPTVGVMGELDSLIIPEHPFADKVTGAAHVCGHNCQIAMMLGAAAAIVKSGVLASLAGKVAFIAVPAEEGIEMSWRDDMRRQGKLHYLGGKPEFIKVGGFEGVDMIMMTHTSSELGEKKIASTDSFNGFIAKRVQFIGKAAHAGSAPHRGVNALNAAMLALNAINTQRETFRDDDTVRVHFILTKGGDAVNAVPADVRLEGRARAKNAPAILDAAAKIDRSLRAGALAVGAKVKITTIPGYMPLVPYPEFWNTLRPNAEAMVGAECIGATGHRTGSSDIGDVSQIMPAIHPNSGGFTGTGHGADYLVKDYEIAVINPTKIMAMTVIDLLYAKAAKAKEVLATRKPPLTREQYLASLDSLLKEEEFQG
jgi:amidohydrolase